MGGGLAEAGGALARCAARRFHEAHELAAGQQMAGAVCEATAGLAACAIMPGQLDEARTQAQAAWDYLKEHGRAGMPYAWPVYRACAETFNALGAAESFRAVLESAHQGLLEVADAIDVPEWRQSFLENVPDNRAIVEMWERAKG